MLDIRWLEDLIAIAETRNFTKASEIRNVTQSGLSRRVQALEHWAGVPLIDRRRSPIDLTEAGYKILTAANEVLGQLHGARRAIRQDHDNRMRSITFAAPHILSVTFFPRWFPALQARMGSIRFSVTSDNLPACAAALEDGVVDFVVCLVDEQQQILKSAGRPMAIEGCASIVIGREKLLPLSAPLPDRSPMHRLDGNPKLSVSSLAYSPECSLAWAVEHLTSSRADLPRLNCLYENSLADGLRTMALSGLGVAWLPLSTTHQDILRNKLVRASDTSFDIDLDIRIYRPAGRMSKKAEELWAQLSAQEKVLDCLDATGFHSAEQQQAVV
jgi:LysR family transcriptional regulator, hypochlorite-specific transcription factor HypT